MYETLFHKHLSSGKHFQSCVQVLDYSPCDQMFLNRFRICIKSSFERMQNQSNGLSDLSTFHKDDFSQKLNPYLKKTVLNQFKLKVPMITLTIAHKYCLYSFIYILPLTPMRAQSGLQHSPLFHFILTTILGGR